MTHIQVVNFKIYQSSWGVLLSIYENITEKQKRKTEVMKIIKILTARLINGREKATLGAQHSTSAKGAAQPIEIENSHKIQKQFEDERFEICRMPSSILPTTRSPVRFLLSFRCRHSEQGVLGDQEAFRTCFSPPHKKAYRTAAAECSRWLIRQDAGGWLNGFESWWSAATFLNWISWCKTNKTF